MWLPADFLTRLDSEQGHRLSDLGQRKRYARNQLVFRAGDRETLVYVLIEGRVKVYQSAQGRDAILWFCAPGEIFGMAEAIRGGPREVSARAVTDSLVLAVPADAFVAFVLDHREIGRTVLETLARRVQSLRVVVMESIASDSAARVIKTVARLARQHGRDVETDILIDLPVTHREIAQMSAASRQTVTSVISDLRRRGLVSVDRRRLRVRDLDALENLVAEPEET